MSATSSEITRLVERWGDGDTDAFEALIELAYDELRDIARHHLSRGVRDGVVDTTVLVHEAYLRLAGVDEWEGKGRAQFFSFCSKAMRHILVDFARKRAAAKRGGDHEELSLEEETVAVDTAVAEVLVVEDVLSRLEVASPRMYQVFECRYYGGLSVHETALALDTSPRTVERDWAKARAYLAQALDLRPRADETSPA